MHDLVPYGLDVLLVAAAVLAAIGADRAAAHVRVPAPALFLVLAAVASAVDPRLRGVPIVDDQRIVTVALALILFDGGMHIGWRRLRPVAGAAVWLGVAGTLVTAAGAAAAAHWVFGLDARTALLVGAAIAPTDPAVVFAVLGRREITGPSGTLLEAESGANDPVGIALMVSLLAAGTGGWHAVGSGAVIFVVQLAVGGAIGAAGGWLLRLLMQRVALANGALYPVRAVALALVLYGSATLAHGSGYLAVFVAGIVVGDVEVARGREIVDVVKALAGLGEIAAFVVLGLSVDLGRVFSHGAVWTGLGLATVLIVLVRPLLGGLVLWPVRLARGERAFVLAAGLKGAVPILLATYVVAEGVAHAHRVYDLVFVVVLVSVVVQGGLAPTLARRWKVPMREVEQP